MAIKRNSCRLSERVRMRDLNEKGLSIPQISNAISVHENIIDEVLSGRWAAVEKEGKKQIKINEAARAESAASEETNKAAAIAAATVKALKELEDGEHSEIKPKRKRRTPAEMEAARLAEVSEVGREDEEAA